MELYTCHAILYCLWQLLANFYKNLFQIDNGSNDAVHQVLISEGAWLTISF